MAKFKKGDRVRVKTLDGYEGAEIEVGETGTILGAKWDHPAFGAAVRFDKHNENKHDCLGGCEDCHGLWVPEESLELLTATTAE